MKGRCIVIKKLIATVAAVAMSLSAFAGIAFAEATYDIELGSGISYTDGVDEYNSQYFTVWCDDLAGLYTSSMQVQIKVISGEIGSDVSNYEFGVVDGTNTKAGLYTPGRSKTYLAGTAYTQNVSTDAEGNQWIKVSWGSSAPAMTDDGMLFEFYITPKDTSADIELEINGDTLVNTCSSTNSDKVDHTFAPEVAPQYVLAAGTSTITAKTTDDGGDDSGDDDTTTNVTLNTYADGDNDAAVSFMETLTAAVGNKITWTLSAKDADGADVSGSYTYEVPNMEIEGDLTVGVIVQYNPTEYNSLAITKGTIQ